MYRKRAASQEAEVLQREVDFELFACGQAPESRWAMSSTKKRASMPEVAGDGTNSFVPESEGLSIASIPVPDMPVPGLRAAKTKPHHRRTSSRVLDTIPMNPLFELWREGDDEGRGKSCPGFGADSWFNENGVNIGTLKRRVAAELSNGYAEGRKGDFAFGGNKRDVPVKNDGVQRTKNELLEKLSRSVPTNGLSEKIRAKSPVQKKKERKEQVPVPWRLLCYLSAILMCSFVVEIITERGQKAIACGTCTTEALDLKARLDGKQHEMIDRLGSLGVALSEQVAQNRLLEDEIQRARQFAKYLEMGGRLYVDRQIQGGEGITQHNVNVQDASIAARVVREWQQGLWRLRYHLGTLVGYVRTNLALPMGNVWDEKLRWLEHVTIGQI